LDATGNMTVDFGLVQRIDLTIAKTITSSGSYTPGVSSVTYSLVATNNGPATAQGAIVVKDKLPAGLTAVSASGTNWTCTPQTGAAVEIVCTRAVGAGTLASGASADPITVTASVDAAATGSLVNVAQVNPSATETIPESIPLGTTNSGYETGNPAVGSNNDDSKSITVAGLTYSVGNRVWNDNGVGGGTANDGLQNGTEPGIDGVTVELLNGTTNAVIGSSITTANGGYYRFDNLPAGDYKVRITKPAGFINTTVPGSGATPNGDLDRDNNGANDAATTVTSNVVTLGPLLVEPINESDLVGGAAAGNAAANGGLDATGNMTVDFGLAPSYSLGNRVWVDTNNNGIIDGAEAGLIGVTVTLLDGSGTPVPGVATQTTDASGYYRFDNLPAGNYRVEIAPPPVNGVNYVSSTGQNASATGPYEAGLTSAATGTNNRDHGTQATPTTIRSGVVAVGPSALINGEVDAGAANAGANGPNGDAFDVLTVDFGIFLPAKLGNLVWFDVNKDGKADPAEPGLNGVSVILRDLNGVEIARQVTRNNPDTGNPGYYQFDYLIPGQYRVEFSAPGYFGTTPGLPSITTGTGPDTNYSQIQPGRDLGATQLVTLAPGDNNPQLDAGYNLTPVEVPALSELMKLFIALLVLSFGIFSVRRRRQ
jgi:uncharacterized repeat protein (TIGR01451 family)